MQLLSRSLIICCCTLCACSKDFTTPPSSDMVPLNGLPQLSGLLNNTHLFGQTPVNGEQSADGYYLTDMNYSSLMPLDQRLYTWQAAIYDGDGSSQDWNVPYAQVYTTNVVLEKLPQVAITPVNRVQWNTTKGEALFFRSYAFHQLAMEFALPYSPQQAQQPGIPLPLAPDPGTVPGRATLQQTYDQLTGDLVQAKDLLPMEQPDSALFLPNKAAACALLARIYLSMGQYTAAGRYADSALAGRDTLVDYNLINAGNKWPFKDVIQPEILCTSSLLQSNVLQAGLSFGAIDSTLYALYAGNDLRKSLYFRPAGALPYPIFRASYTGNVFPFSGLATDEVLLIRAECRARAGDATGCLADVNRLLRKRYKSNTYQPYTAASAGDLLALVLTERRKELVFRGLRWSDLQRLNGEGANITLRRMVNGQPYELRPNQNRYQLPIPADALAGSPITQNPRN